MLYKNLKTITVSPVFINAIPDLLAYCLFYCRKWVNINCILQIKINDYPMLKKFYSKTILKNFPYPLQICWLIEYILLVWVIKYVCFRSMLESFPCKIVLWDSSVHDVLKDSKHDPTPFDHTVYFPFIPLLLWYRRRSSEIW